MRRAIGGRIWNCPVGRVEQRTLVHLRALEPDLVEVYNVYANIGPNLAHIASSGFDLGRAFVDVLRFQRDARLEPDLAFLAFFTETAGLNGLQVNLPFPGGPARGGETLEPEALARFLEGRKGVKRTLLNLACS